jgi:hydrogenase expression/formation protein HypE
MSEEASGNGLSGFACPIPKSEHATVQLAHGGGGRLTQSLIERMFLTAFDNPALSILHDGALLDLEGSRIAVSTDSFVVSPLFFPGGDIGSLAVHGTINDIAMCGARPLALSAGFILEEGLEMEDLWRVVLSMKEAASAAGVPIVTGDTKVVDRGKGDGIFINTTGLGTVAPGVEISPRRARPGDLVLINGPVADHGIAIMSVREGLQFDTALESDTAPLHGLVGRILAVAGGDVHVLRDPTRGGLASALNEIATASSSTVGRPRSCSPRCGRTPSAGRRRSSVRWWRTTPARPFSGAVSEAHASWTCSAGSSFPGSAEGVLARFWRLGSRRIR